MKRAGMKDDFRKAYIHDHLVQIREVLLDGSFEFLEGLNRYEDLCVDSDVKIDWTRLMAYKKQSIGMFDPILEKIFTDMGITVIRGRGKLADAHTVDVDGKKITAEYIVIGTGARNAQLDIPGKEYTHGSSHFLDLDVMPEHMVCIGAGIISMEFASMALMLGKKVTFVFDKEGYLCGAAIYGSEAGTWLDYLTLIIDKKMTATDLRGMIMSFPTQTYMLWSLLAPNLKQF